MANCENSFIRNDMNYMRIEIRNSTRTKLATYLSINPQLETPSLYSDRFTNLFELHRVQFTRLRTSSHDLKVELGRWARPIIPHENRLCDCGYISVQDEWHAIQNCFYTRYIRQEFNNIDFNNLFDHHCKHTVIKICYMICQNFSRDT